MARKSTGKRTRFEVFKRDHFTCQYCGAQPPNVVLVVDHITPVAEGGTDSLENLLTACEPCNQGKAAKLLTVVINRPDADLLYLQTQQEVAEVRRYQHSLIERQAAMESLIPVLQQLWCDCGGIDWHPTDEFFRKMLARYSHEIVGEAVRTVSHKCGSGYIKTYNDRQWPRYFGAVCRNLELEEDEVFGD